MKKAERFLVKQQTTKASKKAYKDGRKRDQLAASQVQKHIPQPGKNFAQQTIWGQNIIDVREFNVDKPKTFEFLGSYDSLESMPQFPLPEIAFLGRSNVGKSSLLNCLTQQHKALAVVSKTPGRTRLMNLFKCSDADGDICIFVDLPGYQLLPPTFLFDFRFFPSCFHLSPHALPNIASRTDRFYPHSCVTSILVLYLVKIQLRLRKNISGSAR